jgi:hypothetical protein
MLDRICHIAAGWCMIGLVALALGPYRFKIRPTIQYPCITTSSHSSNTQQHRAKTNTLMSRSLTGTLSLSGR